MDRIASSRKATPERSEGPSPLQFLLMLPGLRSWRFAGLVLLTLLVALVSGTAVVLLIPMLDVVGLDVTGGAGRQVIDALFGFLQRTGIEPNLTAVLVINVILVSSTAILTRFQSISAAEFKQSIMRGLRQQLYESLVGADWLYLVGGRNSRFRHLLLAEIERVGAAVGALTSLLTSVGRALIYTVIALVLSPVVTLVTALFGLILSLLLLRRTQLARSVGRVVSEAYQGLYSATEDHLASLKLIKSHALEDGRTKAFSSVNEHVARANVDVVRNRSDVGFWLQVGTVVVLSLLLYVALVLLQLPLSTVVMLIFVFSRLLPMLTGIQRNYQSLINLLPAYGRVDEVLQESRSKQESVRDDVVPYSLQRGIELTGVWFSYPDQEGGLRGIDISLPARRTTALAGLSGAGKSTIADLVIGLVSPSRGEVLIDGEPLSPERRRSWRKQVSYVSQDAFLLHDTIRANLLLAKPSASEHELWEALSSASANFVRGLPQGLDTVVGDRGLKLSGGERQRLVLARALLRKPELLILDEATSNLDAQNEERVREAIENLQGRVTILLIAHRLGSLRSTDCIHVIEDGAVVESGSWEKLLRAGSVGRFAALASTQGISQVTRPAETYHPH